jgi:hypothetical protein
VNERLVSRTVADLAVPASLHGVTIYIQIYNLSPQGCMFECDARIEEGGLIQIMLADDVKVQGQVIWSRMNFADVAFVHRLQPALVELLGYGEPASNLDLWAPQDRLGKDLRSVAPRSVSRLH